MKSKTISSGAIFLGLALLLAVLAPALQAQSAAPAGSWQDTSSVYYFSSTPSANPNHNWYAFAMIALAICVLANALVYVAGRTFSLPSVERFAQAEFFQVTASAIMIVAVVFLLNAGFDYIMSPGGLLPSDTTTLCMGQSLKVYETQSPSGQFSGPLAVVQCKLQEKIDYTEALYALAWQNNANVESLTTECTYMLGIPVYCFDWDSALHAKMEQAHLLANRLVPLGISLHAQYMFVQYLANNMLAVFLPIGLVLRIFPFLRGLGGLMIAIAIGFYIVFPIAFILLDPSTVRPAASSLIPQTGAPMPACYNTFSGMVSSLTPASLTATTTGAAENLPDAQQLGQELAKLQIEGFFNPLAALAVTLLFISAATPLLGGDSGEIMHFLTKVI
ncbi:MAG: hypothetical protein KGH63_04740 [Candidatus Micrarchaeota archaeon]|nr:hypothetical protein [Candidatus Micrarchaeota archaeon]